VAVGLLAALKPQLGILLPVIFAIATIGGTGIHLLGINLPAAETAIAFSILAFGIMLALKNTPNFLWIALGAALAGIFHGYAYGEAIIGAEMSPLLSYLTGFALIQIGVASVVCLSAQFVLKNVPENPNLYLRFAGFTICGIGAAFLSSVVLA
ncbi:MAG: hydantoin utilization protein A, partial [Okeania sp. SIO2D1]|nr:hydantoin utilization protein A [Okeania sp. SIO2D1]